MIQMSPINARPFLCAKFSKEPVEGKMPKDSIKLAWAIVFHHVLSKCPYCKSVKVQPDKTFKSKNNGHQWFKCMDCEKRITRRALEDAMTSIFDLAYIQTHADHRGQGHAKDVLEYLKEQCHRINTQMSASSEEGLAACKAAGMKEYPEHDILSWQKPGYEYKVEGK